MEDSKSFNKLFIGGLSQSTTQNSLLSHFSNYGNVKDCVVMMDRISGRSRCFGFVTMEDPQTLERILSEEQIIDSKKTEVKRAVPKDPGLGFVGSFFRTKKIFVGGLPNDINKETFRTYFQQFGEIEDCVLMLDKDTGKPRGFGFITFADEDSTEKVLENFDGNYINGKWIDCKKAVPKQEEHFSGFGTSLEELYGAEEFVPGNYNFG